MVSPNFDGWHEDFGDEPGIEERIPAGWTVVATFEDDSAWDELDELDDPLDLYERRETEDYEVRDDRELGGEG